MNGTGVLKRKSQSGALHTGLGEGALKVDIYGLHLFYHANFSVERDVGQYNRILLFDD